MGWAAPCAAGRTSAGPTCGGLRGRRLEFLHFSGEVVEEPGTTSRGADHRFMWSAHGVCPAKRKMLFYRRRLPHWVPEHSTLFVTWRLAGSIPPSPPPMLTQENTSRTAFCSTMTGWTGSLAARFVAWSFYISGSLSWGRRSVFVVCPQRFPPFAPSLALDQRQSSFASTKPAATGLFST